jgi:hypothetical protein
MRRPDEPSGSLDVALLAWGVVAMVLMMVLMVYKP